MLFETLKNKPFFILGPCVIESQNLLNQIAAQVMALHESLQIPIVFKASFDKANRTSIHSYRGPGLEKGMEMLRLVKERYSLPLCVDIHETYQAGLVATIADVIQIPAFLCRQTDLLLAAAKTGKIVHLKKAQFLSASDMVYPVQKILTTGNRKIILTERGNTYGPHNLVVDFRNIYYLQELGYPVCMDCTHAVQQPGAAGDKTGGDQVFVPMMALAAKAFGVHGYFMEVHPDPQQALSDGPNMLPLGQLKKVILSLLKD